MAVTARKPERPATGKQRREGYVARANPAARGVQFIIARPRGKATTALQSVVFTGARWTRARAIAWLKAYGLRTGPLEQRGTTLRVRQASLAAFQAGTFRTITPGRIEPPVTLGNPKRAARHARVAVPKRELEAAVDLYQKFREARPRRLRAVRFKLPTVCMVIGEMDFVGYTTTHAKKRARYQHNFGAGARPLLCSSADGRQLLIFGGNYDFTRDGIVDRA